jgi:hypothetical protein
VRIVPTAVGHALPTGDLFRRLRISLQQTGAEAERAAVADRVLARHWEDQAFSSGVPARYVAHDDRPGLAGTEPTQVDLPIPQSAPLRWRVAIDHVLFGDARDDRKALVTKSVTVAEGLVPAPSPNEAKRDAKP